MSTFNCLAPLLLKRVIYRSYASEKYHGFDKAWVFKNPATFVVLRVLYEPLAKSPDLQRMWVAFWENIEYESKAWNAFEGRIRSTIESLYELSYRKWTEARRETDIDHNGFFKNKEAMDGILEDETARTLGAAADKTYQSLLKSG